MTVPEAQLQAYTVAIVREALPHEPPENFRVEKWLKIRIGHNVEERDGTADWEGSGRADLLVYHHGRPLAVVELKREDQTLTDSDVDQARSYAVAMIDRPPLVIVSNGNATWVRQTIDGAELDPTIDGVAFVEKLFENIGKLAAADNAWAIETLMGPEASIWVESVRRQTDDLIERMTGEADDMRKPFPRDFLFARAATADIVGLFEGGARAVVADGAPLAGKSNVLRELSRTCRTSPDWAILMINAAPHGPGLFQRIANLFGEALEWKLSKDDVRTWLRRMSRSQRRPALVLAVDGLVAGTQVMSDIEELAESGFEDGLRIVVTVDRASDIMLDASGRGETAFAAIAGKVEVEPLNDQEFQRVREDFAERRILFYGGAELAQEYRTAWMLRSVLADGSAPAIEDHAAVIPATMGLKTIRAARTRLNSLVAIARLHRLVARDAVADEEVPDAELALAQANAFVVRRDVLTASGEDAARELESQGWLSFHRHHRGDDILVFRAPEFMLSELAHELSESLDRFIDDDVDEAAARLIFYAERFFLGDLIGAQAVVDLAARRKALPLDLLGSLMNCPPEFESMAGKVIGIADENGNIFNVRFDEHCGFARADEEGHAITPFTPPDPDEDLPGMYGRFTPWLILSQLARLPSVFGPKGGERFDFEILLHVGQNSFPLMRGNSNLSMGHTTQSLGAAGSVLALPQALAEPITAAMHKVFAVEWRVLGPFLERVVVADSLPLTARVHCALVSLQGSADDDLDQWVDVTLRTTVLPLLRRQLSSSAK